MLSVECHQSSHESDRRFVWIKGQTYMLRFRVRERYFLAGIAASAFIPSITSAHLFPTGILPTNLDIYGGTNLSYLVENHGRTMKELRVISHRRDHIVEEGDFLSADFMIKIHVPNEITSRETYELGIVVNLPGTRLPQNIYFIANFRINLVASSQSPRHTVTLDHFSIQQSFRSSLRRQRRTSLEARRDRMDGLSNSPMTSTIDFLVPIWPSMINSLNIDEFLGSPLTRYGGEASNEALPQTKPLQYRDIKSLNSQELLQECVICLETISKIKKGEKIVQTPCAQRNSEGVSGHFFHQLCIERWLRTKSSCPICRTAVSIYNRIDR